MALFVHKVDESFDPEKHFGQVPLYQSALFRRWQERFGNRVISLVTDDSDTKAQVFAQCVEYTLPVIGSVWVVAHGPVGSFESDAGEEAFYKEMRSLCAEMAPKTSHIRFQRKPVSQQVRAIRAELAGGIFMQPLTEQVISLDCDFEDVVSDFSPQTYSLTRRYERGKHDHIRLHVEKNDFKKYLDVVYALLKEVDRSVLLQRFALRPYTYYKALFEELTENAGRGMLVLGYVEGHEQPVTFALAVYNGSTAYHLFSGSSSVGYKNDVPTLVFYIILKETKEQGADRYVVGDIDSIISDDLDVLREEFGGEEVTHTDVYDCVVSGWRYYLFRLLRLYPVIVIRRLLVRLYKAVEVELTSED